VSHVYKNGTQVLYISPADQLGSRNSKEFAVSLNRYYITGAII